MNASLTQGAFTNPSLTLARLETPRVLRAFAAHSGPRFARFRASPDGALTRRRDERRETPEREPESRTLVTPPAATRAAPMKQGPRAWSPDADRWGDRGRTGLAGGEPVADFAFPAGRRHRQSGDHRPAACVRVELGDHRRQDDPLRQDSEADGPVREDLLVRPVAGGALSLALRPHAAGHGFGLRRRDARVEAELRGRRARPSSGCRPGSRRCST